MTINANSFVIVVNDEGGQTSTISGYIPSSVAEVAALTFSDDFAELCKAVIVGGVEDVAVTFKFNLGGWSLKAVAETAADCADKFMMTFRSVIDGIAKTFIPSISETHLLPDGTPDPASTQLINLMAAHTVGLTLTDTSVVGAVDKYNSDITTITNAKELFKKKGKPRQ